MLLSNKSDLEQAVSHEKIILICRFDTVLKDFNIRGATCSALQNVDIDKVVEFIRSK